MDSNVIVMTRTANMSVTYAPMYIHSFRLPPPHVTAEEKTGIKGHLFCKMRKNK